MWSLIARPVAATATRSVLYDRGTSAAAEPAGGRRVAPCWRNHATKVASFVTMTLQDVLRSPFMLAWPLPQNWVQITG